MNLARQSYVTSPVIWPQHVNVLFNKDASRDQLLVFIMVSTDVVRSHVNLYHHIFSLEALTRTRVGKQPSTITSA